MVNKCSVIGCKTNYKRYEKGTVFPLPTEKELRQQWIKFLHRQDSHSVKNIFIRYKHFAENLIKSRRLRKARSLYIIWNRFPTSLRNLEMLWATLQLQSYKVSRVEENPPKERLFREDELSKFEATDKINSIDDITDKKVKYLGQNFKITWQQDHISVYCLENNPDAIPQITYCIKMEQSLWDKLFHKGTSMPLLVLFRKGRNTHLTSWSMVPNLIVYIKQKAE